MTPKNYLLRRGGVRRLFVSVNTILALATAGHADTLIWDTNAGIADAQDGTGTWAAASPNWFNQTQALQNQTWANGSDAVFGAGNGIAGTIILSGPVTAGNVTFNAGSTVATYALGGSGTLTLVNSTITNNAAGAISAIIAGTTPWIKTGAGALTLNGATTNTHSGLLTVNQGRLDLAKSGGATAVAGDLTITNGAFVTSSGSTTNQIAATAAVSMSGAASVFNGTGPNAGPGNSLNQTLRSLTITGGTFNAGAGSNWTVTGAMSLTASAANSIVFVGNSGMQLSVGSLSLVGMNGGSSSTSVTNGFTIFGNAGTRGTVTVGSGGLYLENSTIHLKRGTTAGVLGSRLVLNGDVTTAGTTTSLIRRDGAEAEGLTLVELSGTAGNVSRTFNIAGGGANLNISVSVTNGAATAASVIKTGTGTLIFSGGEANTYTGDTIINGGTLQLNKTAGVTAVAGNIIVNNGGVLTLTTSNQIADTAGITVNGGAITAWSTDETFAFYTQTAGGASPSGNTGHVILTGALTLAGGNTLTINSGSPTTPPSWNVGSAVLTGADILIGGNNGVGGAKTSLTIGAGGLTMAGRTITLNGGTAGVLLNLNGDFTGTGTNNIVNGGGAGVQPLVAIGSATRTFNVINGTTTISAEISGAGGSLVKTGVGLLQLTTANSYTGSTTVSGGTLSVSGTAGFLGATSAVVVNGGGILQNGSSTAASNNGLANRINSAATLTMGGGAFNQISAATGTHTQSLVSLGITGGANTVNVTAAAGTTNTLTFTGATPYTRTAGSVNFVENAAVGGSVVFTNVPSGAGNVSGGALVGATLNGTDLVAAQAGALTAFTGWVPTGTSTWTTGAAMDVTGSNATAYAGTNITALRFNTAGPFTVTLDGTHTIDTDVILMTSAAGAGASLITGGTLQGTAGGDLVVAQNNTAGTLEIASTIGNNTSATGLSKNGGGVLILSGANTHSGTTRVNEGVLRAADGVGLPTGSALVLSSGVFESSGSTFNRALGTAAGEVSVIGGASGFSAFGTAATFNLGGSGAVLQWGGANFNPGTLVLNNTTATAALELVNAIDLNGLDRSIRVDTNTATISGVISNSMTGSSAGLNKLGAGTLALTGVNTYTGRTLATAGYIALSQDRNLGAALAAPVVDSLILANGGRIRASASFTLDANRGIGIGNSSGGAASAQIDVVTNATFIIAGTIANRTMNQDGTASTGTNVGALTKTGTGVLELAGNNTYSGVTSVSNGILRVKSNTALGSTAGGTTVASGGHVELGDGVVVTGETITINSTAGTTGPGSPQVNRGGLQAAANATAEWAGDVILGVDLARLGVQEGGTLKISGNITDGASSFILRLSGELTGTGGIILSGTGNAWDGETEIVRGKVFLGVHNALPTTTVLDIHFTNTNNAEYAGLDMNGFNQTISSLRNDGGTGANAELTNSSRTLSTMTVNEAGTTTYAGVINGNVALVKNGAGTMILTQVNRLTGGITVNDGILRISTASALGEGDVAVNGGTTTSGKLDVNNVTTFVDALNGSAGTLAGIIANESATNATRTFSIGVNHGSGAYAGQIVDNTGGTALGKIAVAKIGSGTQTLSGTGTYTGTTFVSNGTLVADYASGSPLGSSAVSLQGGTLVIRNASTTTLGNLSLVQSGTDFTNNVLRIEGSGTVTTPTFAASGFAPLLIDLSSGSTLVATSLSSTTVTGGILMGSSGRSTILVQDAGGMGFATRNGSNQIVRYASATTLDSASAATSGTANYVINADLTRSATLNFQTLQIETSAGDVTLSLGTNNLVTGASGRTVLITGNNDATISATTGAGTSGSLFIANHGTGTTTLNLSLSGQALVNIGTGLVDYTHSANTGDLYAAGGVMRLSGADRDFNTGITRIYGGGVLEIGADLNDTADGAFTRAVGQAAAGQVALIGNGGFSAYGADRVVALGGTAAPTALTWGAGSFFSGPGGDNNYTFMLGSVYSTHTLEFQNAINLGTRERIIEVADGTSSTNTDARLTGVISGSGGSVVKEGTGRLEFTAANTYTGRTDVNAGSLVITSTGRTGTGAVAVASGAALMGSGQVQGASFTLANGAALHAGNDTTPASMGTLTFQTAAKGSFEIQSGSAVTLDIQSATNQLSIDPNFGGNAIGSAGYNAFVDAFSGTGTGTHDLLSFGGAAGSTLVFSGNLTVRPEGFSAAMGQVFNLVDWTTLVGADFAGFNVGANFRTGADDNLLQFDLPELTGGLLWDISRFTSSGVIVIVPEPGRALMLMLGLMAWWFRRRR